MPIAIKMPALSPTMEEGTLARWLVKEGDAVKSGDILAEIETDKATMEFEAVDEGTVSRIMVPEGSENVKVGTVIAVLVEEGLELGLQRQPDHVLGERRGLVRHARQHPTRPGCQRRTGTPYVVVRSRTGRSMPAARTSS